MTTNDDVEQTEDYLRVTARISEGWGKYLAVFDEWLPVIYETDRKLAELDPDYEIQQVKEKFWGLRYYFTTKTNKTGEMNVIIEDAERQIAEIEKRLKRAPAWVGLNEED